MEFAGKFCSLVEILQHKFIAASVNICSFYSNIAPYNYGSFEVFCLQCYYFLGSSCFVHVNEASWQHLVVRIWSNPLVSTISDKPRSRPDAKKTQIYALDTLLCSEHV